MNTILHILKKEFLQIFRNKSMLPLIFVMPIIQLLILSNAATYEIKNINYCLVDLDQSTFSRDLAERFRQNGYFILKGNKYSTNEAIKGFNTNEWKLILYIPENFEKDFRREGKSKMQLLINAEDGAAAGLINNYSSNIIQQFNQDIITEYIPSGSSMNMPPLINVNFRNWYNPELNYKTYMVPGILVALVTMIGTFLTGMNIAREKEIGTIEQLNVTPIKKYQFITGKLFPFWIIGLFVLAFGLLIGKIIYGIPVLGSPLVLFSLASIYLISMLGIGLFISTVTETQQQAMFIAWFIMVIFILLGGIFTAVESMPDWAQRLTYLNPISHFSKAIRMILLKGSGFRELAEQFTVLSVFAFLIIALAVFRYRKTN